MIWLTALQLGLTVLPQLLKAINTIAQEVEKDAPAQSGPAKAEMVKNMINTVIDSADEVCEEGNPEAKAMIKQMVSPGTEAVVKFHNATGTFSKPTNPPQAYIDLAQ